MVVLLMWCPALCAGLPLPEGMYDAEGPMDEDEDYDEVGVHGPCSATG